MLFRTDPEPLTSVERLKYPKELEPTIETDELWLTDALHKLSTEQKVLVHPVNGRWYTTGDPLRFLIASIEYGLRHPEIGKSLAEYLSTLLPLSDGGHGS